MIMVTLTLDCIATQALASPTYNRFAYERCQKAGVSCIREVSAGETWESLFPDADYRTLVMAYNRQTRPLATDQRVVTPSRSMTWAALSPLPQQWSDEDQCQGLVIDIDNMAIGLYDENCRLRMWAPSTMGAAMERGSFHVLQVASEHRISDELGAPIPWFLQVTYNGIGIHAGELRGLHDSNGCARVPDNFARKLNVAIRRWLDLPIDNANDLEYIPYYDLHFTQKIPVTVI